MLSWTNLRWVFSSVAVRRIVGQPGRPHLYFLPACRSMCCRRACLQCITYITADDIVFHLHYGCKSRVEHISPSTAPYLLKIPMSYSTELKSVNKWSPNIRAKINTLVIEESCVQRNPEKCTIGLSSYVFLPLAMLQR